MYVVISFSPLPQKIQCSSLFFAPEWTTLTQGLDEWRVYNDIGVLCVSKCKILNTFCPISLPYKYKKLSLRQLKDIIKWNNNKHPKLSEINQNLIDDGFLNLKKM